MMPVLFRLSHFFQRLAQAIPWQVSLIASFVLFLVLHYLSERVPRGAEDNPWSIIVLQTLQWLVPLSGIALFISSLCSRQAASVRTTYPQVFPSTNAINTQVFEHLCAQFFRFRGYRVTILLSDKPQAPPRLSLKLQNELYLAYYQYWHPKMGLPEMIAKLQSEILHHQAKGGFLVVEQLPPPAAQIKVILPPEITLISASEIIQNVSDAQATT